MTVILRITRKGAKPTRTEYDNWHHAQNDASLLGMDKDLTVTVFLKGGKWDLEELK